MHSLRPLAVVLIIAASAGTAGAAPGYAREASAARLSQARDKTTDEVAWLDVDGSRSFNRYSCKTKVLLVNATPRIRWAVRMLATQEFGTHDRRDIIQLPFMLPGTQAYVELPCPDIGYQTGDATLSVRLGVVSDEDPRDGVQWMAEHTVNNTWGATIMPDGVGTDPRNMLTATLELDDADTARALVGAIVATKLGVDELVERITKDPDSNLAHESGALLRKISGDAQLALAKNLLNDADRAARNERDLLPVISKLCGVEDREAVLTLWTLALDDEYATPALRRAIRSRCAPRRDDAALLSQMNDPDILDQVDDGLFSTIVAGWSTTAPSSALLGKYLAVATRSSRFATVAAFAKPEQNPLAIPFVISSVEPKLVKARVAWLTQAIAALEGPTLDTVASDVSLAKLRSGSFAPAYQELADSLLARSPKAVTAAHWQIAAESQDKLDTTKLAAANVDAAAFRDFATSGALRPCADVDTVKKVLACADVIEHSAVPNLPKAAGGALTPKFAEQVEKVFESMSDETIAGARALVERGWNLQKVGEKWCEEVRGQLEVMKYRVDQLRSFGPTQACIAAIDANLQQQRDEAAAQDQRMRIYGIVGLVGPLVLGIGLLVLWWRRRPVLDAAAVVETPVGVHRDKRLDSLLGSGLASGIEAARRDLAMPQVDEDVIRQAKSVIQRAVASGSAASTLVRDSQNAVYILALPVREAQPQVVQRFVGAAWPEHIRRVRELAGTPLTSLVVLCGPDAKEATLLAGQADETRSSEPDLLLGAREARERGANSFQYTISLGG